ncbi:MAG: omptin family outer membrane protease [Treponema sp.]|nr:omptin family outer membrane protease [Treponema sp.]
MKKALLFTALFLIHLSLPADEPSEKTAVVKINPYTAMTLGKYSEYIYTTPPDEYLISYLEWQTLPLFQAGLNTQLNLKQWTLEADFCYSFPFNCGKMYDNDYTRTFKMCYNIFDSKDILGLEIFSGFDYKIQLTEKISMKPTLKLMYCYNHFSANNGYGWFGSAGYSATGDDEPWNSEYAYKAKKVSGIEYSRHDFYSFFGLNLDYNINKLNFGITTLIAPFAYTKTLDYHKDEIHSAEESLAFYMAGIQTSFFTRFDIELYCKWQLNEKLSFIFNTKAVFGLETRGKLYVSYEKNSSYGLSDQPSANDLTNFKITTGISYCP